MQLVAANGNHSHSLIVSAAFPSGKMRQKSILGASFYSHCDPLRIRGDTSLFPPQASLPACELLWLVSVLQKLFLDSLERCSPEAHGAQPQSELRLPHAALAAPLLHWAGVSQKGTQFFHPIFCQW